MSENNTSIITETPSIDETLNIVPGTVIYAQDESEDLDEMPELDYDSFYDEFEEDEEELAIESR
jgi:hypothetical protein